MAADNNSGSERPVLPVNSVLMHIQGHSIGQYLPRYLNAKVLKIVTGFLSCSDHNIAAVRDIASNDDGFRLIN